MFAGDVTELGAAETLAATRDWLALQGESEIRVLQLALRYADLHPSPARVPDDQRLPGGERGVVYGGAGCPAVAEFAVAEFAAVLGVTSETGGNFIGQALALRHRLPLTWARVEAGQATGWKARLIATACLGLSVEAAALVDARVAGVVDSLSAHQVKTIVKAAVWDADPAAARAAAEQKARERGAWPGQSDQHGTTTLFVKAASGDVIRFDATLGQIADALAALGDPDSLDQRRAKALGILADPAFAHELLQVAQYLATRHHPTTGDDGTDAPAATDAPTAAADPARAGDTARADDTTRAGDSAQAEAAPGAATCEGSTSATDAELTPADQAPATEDFGPRSGAAPAGNPPTTIDAERAGDAQAVEVTRDGQPASDLFLADEPGADTEADRDAPHPCHPDQPLDAASRYGPRTGRGRAEQILWGMDAAARHDLVAKLAAIKRAADTGGGGRRPGRIKLYVHITDETLLAGGGTARVEAFGPVFAAKLAELLGHDRITVQPVIDLNDHVSVNAYEIPHRIRERVKLTYPVEQFPYGTGETTTSTDLDHVVPFDPTGPPGQTSTSNLRPLRRFSHRVKTHADWTVRALDDQALEWTTKHGFKFHVDHTGTHPITNDDQP
ncbi:hypothetical protein GCM10009744_17860 [Kribbella alba]|uniref:DUF222 domain-containing protein n=1 Tax=Kribbella alba TaxID=190197 RepID=A0ABN2F6J9_9ACTN